MRFAKVQIYLRNSGGAKFEYEINALNAAELGVKAREHTGQIFLTGYRHNTGKGEFTHYGPHWIDKIKVIGDIPTGYPDRASGT